MSKTSPDKKAKKAKTVQEVPSKVEGRKASEKVAKATPEVVTDLKETEVAETPVKEEAKEETKAKQAKVRGKKYRLAKKKVDINKYYPVAEAVKLVKETSISKFDGKVESHITLIETIGTIGDIVFPHLEATSKKVVILNDAILSDIKNGQINFDILIATPATMSKLLPFARVLGPKGLMPNPKNGTLTDKPEETQKKLSVARTTIKTESKAPLVHMIVGKVSQPEKELVANIEQLIKVIGSAKIKKYCLCATMGPSIKLEIVR